MPRQRQRRPDPSFHRVASASFERAGDIVRGGARLWEERTGAESRRSGSGSLRPARGLIPFSAALGDRYPSLHITDQGTVANFCPRVFAVLLPPVVETIRQRFLSFHQCFSAKCDSSAYAAKIRP